MRTFQLRVYTLRSQEALSFYTQLVYPRHLTSFPLFGIEPHGFWTAKDDTAPRLYVLASFAPGADPAEVVRRYMQSPELAHDVRDFDVSNIVAVESTLLTPSTGSPLQ